MTHITEEFEFTKEHLTEFVKCKKDPIYFIKNYFNIQHPSKGAIKFDLYPYQEDLIRGYEDNQFNVVLPARQVGTTAVSSAYILWFNIFHNDKTTLVTSNKHDHAIEIMYRIRFAYDTLPEWFRLFSKLVEKNKNTLGFENGSRIMAQAISPCTGRGMAISLLYIDSFAFVRPSLQEEFWMSLAPTLCTGGRCIISSTPDSSSDMFAKIWREACDGENGFNPVHIEWFAPLGRDERFKQDVVKCIGEKSWRQEYECEFMV